MKREKTKPIDPKPMLLAVLCELSPLGSGVYANPHGFVLREVERHGPWNHGRDCRYCGRAYPCPTLKAAVQLVCET